MEKNPLSKQNSTYGGEDQNQEVLLKKRGQTPTMLRRQCLSYLNYSHYFPAIGLIWKKEKWGSKCTIVENSHGEVHFKITVKKDWLICFLRDLFQLLSKAFKSSLNLKLWKAGLWMVCFMYQREQLLPSWMMLSIPVKEGERWVVGYLFLSLMDFSVQPW